MRLLLAVMAVMFNVVRGAVIFIGTRTEEVKPWNRRRAREATPNILLSSYFNIWEMLGYQAWLSEMQERLPVLRNCYD